MKTFLYTVISWLQRGYLYADISHYSPLEDMRVQTISHYSPLEEWSIADCDWQFRTLMLLYSTISMWPSYIVKWHRASSRENTRNINYQNKHYMWIHSVFGHTKCSSSGKGYNEMQNISKSCFFFKKNPRISYEHNVILRTVLTAWPSQAMVLVKHVLVRDGDSSILVVAERECRDQR